LESRRGKTLDAVQKRLNGLAPSIAAAVDLAVAQLSEGGISENEATAEDQACR